MASIGYSKQQKSPRGAVGDGDAGLFFRIGLGYLTIFLLIAIAYLAWQWLHGAIDGSAAALFLGVPWFGGLGAVTISLYGVFRHNQRWHKEWNYWHVARPLVGMVLGTMSCLILFGVVRMTDPDAAAVQELPTGGYAQVPYFVLSFIVGFREATFRKLITKATDLMLGGPDESAGRLRLSAQESVDFEDVPVDGTVPRIVEVAYGHANSDDDDAEEAVPITTRIVPAASPFKAELAEEHSRIQVGGVRAIPVVFTPGAEGAATATLIIDGPGESVVVPLSGRGVAKG